MGALLEDDAAVVTGAEVAAGASEVASPSEEQAIAKIRTDTRPNTNNDVRRVNKFEISIVMPRSETFLDRTTKHISWSGLVQMGEFDPCPDS